MKKKQRILFVVLGVIIGFAISIFYYLNSLNCEMGYIRVYEGKDGGYNCNKICPRGTKYICKSILFDCSCIRYE